MRLTPNPDVLSRTVEYAIRATLYIARWDLTISLAPGHYYFQCDPHAALGMVARLEVEDEDD